MSFQKGQWVRHPKCPDWGPGQVLEDAGGHARVLFQIGEKIVSQNYASLELTDPPQDASFSHSITMQPDIGMEKLRQLCNEFHSEMKDNREGFNDGGMALEVIRDFESKGELSKETAKRLFAWCHTDRPVYLRGVDLAQRICREIYGRIPTKDELRAIGQFK